MEFLTDQCQYFGDEFDEVSIENILENMKENSIQSNYLTFETLPSNDILSCNF